MRTTPTPARAWSRPYRTVRCRGPRRPDGAGCAHAIRHRRRRQWLERHRWLHQARSGQVNRPRSEDSHRPGRRTYRPTTPEQGNRPTAHRSPWYVRCRARYRGIDPRGRRGQDTRHTGGAPQDESRRIDAARGSFPPEVIDEQTTRRFVVAAEQPKHAARNRRQDARPRVENLRVELVGLIEATKNEAVFGQSKSCARRSFRTGAADR